MKGISAITGAVVVGLLHSFAMAQSNSPRFLDWARTPPMGWNSWDCYGTGVTEEQTRANVDYMADKLKSHGWQYIIVDIQWYEPQARTDRYRRGAVLNTDKNGRLMPAPNRFPSAADGRGFKPLADYVHSKGLKFGIHLMRGIPRQAVGQNLPIWGTEHKASEIADKTNVCRWNTDMYGVDMSKPGAQEYYDSVLALLASWDVDYVKVDDLSAPNYHKAEVEGIRQAIDKTGRAMVLSTSPGATSLDVGEHIATHANLWRISNDFWDTWKSLKEQFDRCNNWSKFTAPGHWPDADMLPIGAIRQWRNDNWTRFTKDEQITLLTLWSICRSPLMMGGDMPKCDEFTLSLLTNDEVIDVNQHSVNGRQLFRNGDQVAWVADIPDAKDKYLALFNAADQPQNAAEDPVAIKVMMKDLGFDKECTIRDLWKHNDIGSFGQEFSQRIPYHGAGLYKVSPK